MAGRENPLLEPRVRIKTDVHHAQHRQQYAGATVRLAFVGDSMLARFGTTGADALATIPGPVALLAVGGDGIQQLLYRLDAERSVLREMKVEHGVLLMIGTNDLARHEAGHIAEGIHAAARAVRASTDAPVHVLALSHLEGVPRDKVDAVNRAAAARLAAEHRIAFLDPFGGFDASCYDEDGGHFNAHGYARWREALRAVVD